MVPSIRASSLTHTYHGTRRVGVELPATADAAQTTAGRRRADGTHICKLSAYDRKYNSNKGLQ